MKIVATAMHLAEDLWRVNVSCPGAVREVSEDVHGGVLVVDVARKLGATHIRWRDVLDANCIAKKNPFPVDMEL